jgi:multidrug transporter EmrE-like cation transporter
VLQLIVVLVKGTVKTEIRFCFPGSLGGFLEGMATYIVLYLAASQNASVLFPVVSVAKIIAVWCIGRLAFKEQLKIWQTVGLVAGVAAIALLNLK